ncbi:hypothetical protein Ddye_007652 [Dipteronia dyeriana]|uniref:RNase H type-1 domain-containing protein n=1 Tax=Dipteronia dyeriana TaxID=168575 RepID=A0AAE0CRV9_9ROSI|nr:hypothetical protein Ddye_007652 [Dipteronia dyeriana]
MNSVRGQRDRRPRFHYERGWENKKGCLELIQAALKEGNGDNYMSKMVNKLGSCERNLQRWNKDNKRKLNESISLKRNELFCLSETGGLVDWTRYRKVERELDNLLYKEETLWHQRSRVLWLKWGDRNTKFFHAKAYARRSCNMIRELYDDDGIWQTKDEEMVIIINNYFSSPFSNSQPSSNDLEGVFGSVESRLLPHLRDFLDGQFTTYEIRCDLFQMNPSKAPSSDGFPVDFYQKFWPVIREDVTQLCLECLNRGRLVVRFNHYLLYLIPKVKKVERMSGLNPISLCNVIFKCISKAFAKRLRNVLNSVIADTQSAFIPGRCITDNDMVRMHACLASKGVSGVGVCRKGKCTGASGSPYARLVVMEGNSDSFLWKSLLWGRELLEKGSRWRVEDGQKILTYRDRWIPRLSTFKVFSPPVLGELTIVDMLHSINEKWNDNMVRQNFFKEDAESVEFLKNFQQVHVGEGGVSQRFSRRVLRRPPSLGLFKINTDVALSSRDKTTGLGVVIRDSDGRVMSSLCGNVGGCYEPHDADVMAILCGLQHTLETGLFPASLESVSLSLVILIKAKEIPNSKVGMIIHDILNLFDNACFIFCDCVPRSANKVAHGHAKLVLAYRG